MGSIYGKQEQWTLAQDIWTNNLEKMERVQGEEHVHPVNCKKFLNLMKQM